MRIINELEKIQKAGTKFQTTFRKNLSTFQRPPGKRFYAAESFLPFLQRRLEQSSSRRLFRP